MWSAGCTVYELCTGRILFSGDDNNGMLKVGAACHCWHRHYGLAANH